MRTIRGCERSVERSLAIWGSGAQAPKVDERACEVDGDVRRGYMSSKAGDDADGTIGGDERSQWGRAPASCVSVDGKSHMGAVPSKNDDLYDQDTSRRIYKKLISKLLLSQSLHTTTHKHKTPTQNSHSSYFPPTIARLLFSNFSFKNSYTVNVTACPGATLMIRGVIPL